MKKKYLLIVFILAISILVINCKSLVRSYLTKMNFDQTLEDGQLEWKRFYWSRDTIAGRFTPKAAIYLPVQYNDSKETFLMQLDLGPTNTSFYRSIQNLPDQNKNHIDTINSKVINASLTVGNTLSRFKKTHLYKKIDYEKLNGMTKLGNLGYDFFKDKLLIIDFADTLFAVTTNHLESISLTDLKNLPDVSISKFPVLLPAKVENEKVYFMWDTGSSTFDIMLPPKTFNSLSP